MSSLYRSILNVQGGVDADAQAFITAASITDPTQQSAINTLVTDLKGYGVWTKMKAIYPFVGGTATSHKFNLKDPQDTDAAFRLVFNGGWTHSSTGALPNGNNGWADTFVKTGTDLALNSTHLSVYSRTDAAAADRLAIGNCFGAATFELSMWLKTSTSNTTHRNNTSSFSQVSNSDSRGFYIGNRNSSTQQKIIKNTTINTFNVNSIATTNSFTINISSALQANGSGFRSYYDNKELAFSSIGDGLTDTEAANFYTAVQAFQTTLGRSIGTQTVSDADAQAFVTNAGIVDQVEANAVNNLVIGLKADSLWTKMKAVYPMVGETSSTMKYNLVNPLDTDAAFRLVFNGGWTFGSTGATPNGTNGYADTKLNDNTENTLNNVHISVYSRTNSTIQSADISSYDGTNSTSIYPYISNAIYTRAHQTAISAVTSFVDSLGLFIANRTNSTQLFTFKNTTKYTSAFNSVAKSNQNFTLSRASATVGNYSNREIAFASIGEGLTDTEASNLYNRVQAFNTTLNRQV